MSLPNDQLKSIIISAKVISEKDFEIAAAYAKKENVSVWDALVQKAIIKDKDLGTIVANHLKLPFIDLSKVEITEEIISVIPERVARKQRAVAYDRDENVIKVAISDPSAVELLKLLEKKTGKKIAVSFATDQDLENTLLNYTKDFQKVFDRLLKHDASQIFTSTTYDPPVAKMVDLLIQTALNEKASDIHIEPQEKEFFVRFRIDGILHNILTLQKELHDRIVTRIKVLSRLRTDEHLSAQDGKMKIDFDGERLDLRISIIPIAEGEKVVMRLLSAHARNYSLSDLGFSDQDLLKLTNAAKRSFGMIISTGPTGSGKTTTVYSTLKTIDVKEKNLTSIEDPIEYRIQGANQVQVNAKTDLTFANGLRSLLRQDPDYIFVGEIRDNETAAIATNAALTGHLVFSTLHTNTAAAALPRLIDMQVEPFLVASTVNVIIGQRLVRRICEHCRVSETISLEDLQKNLSIETIKKHAIPLGDKKEIRVYKGKGCKACHFTGYSGRIGVFEVLEVTKKIRELITQKADTDTLHRAAVEEGMLSMLDDGILKITKGLTTIEEILRVITTEM